MRFRVIQIYNCLSIFYNFSAFHFSLFSCFSFLWAGRHLLIKERLLVLKVYPRNLVCLIKRCFIFVSVSNIMTKFFKSNQLELETSLNWLFYNYLFFSFIFFQDKNLQGQKESHTVLRQ